MHRGRLRVLDVDRSERGIIVDFSDGTQAVFTAEELAALRPERVSVERRDISGDVIRSRDPEST